MILPGEDGRPSVILYGELDGQNKILISSELEDQAVVESNIQNNQGEYIIFAVYLKSWLDEIFIKI